MRSVRSRQLASQEKEDGGHRGSPRDLLRLLRYARPYSLRLGIALFSLLIAGLLGLTFPQIVRLLVDAAFTQHNAHRLNVLAVTLVALFAAQAAFSFLRTYLLSYTGERVVADIRIQLYNHLTTLPASFFASRRVGELISRLASDTSVIQTVTTGSMTELLRQSLVLTGGIIIISVTNPRLTLVMLAIVPAVILFARFYGAYVRRLSTKVQDRLADAGSVIEETLSAIRIVQSFVREDDERRRYRSRVTDALELAVKRAVASGGFVAFKDRNSFQMDSACGSPQTCPSRRARS
ncbi:MAG TPA: ABC transporter transmembrane domain-containing protein [Blastocatellia bacterium]